MTPPGKNYKAEDYRLELNYNYPKPTWVNSPNAKYKARLSKYLLI
jgi:hypothetical protein